MRRFGRRIPLLATLVVILLTTGCVTADYHVTAHKDGSGFYRVKVLTHPMIIDQLNPIRKKMVNGGFQVREIHEGNRIGWLAEKQVKNMAQDPPGRELKKSLNLSDQSAGRLPLSEERSTGPVRVEKSWFRYRILLRTDADLTRLKADHALERFLQDETDLRFRLTLPLKPKKHNADQVSGDGKTLTWKLHPGEKNPVRVLVEFPNPMGWILVPATALILLLFLFLLFRCRSSRHRG